MILTPISGPQDILAPASNNGSTRLLWDMLFTLITVSILGAIITGIICDTFGQLRDEKDEAVRYRKEASRGRYPIVTPVRGPLKI